MTVTVTVTVTVTDWCLQSDVTPDSRLSGLSRYEAVELTAVANNDAEAGVANDDEDECTLI